jgi:large subunit ribosomal protein L29
MKALEMRNMTLDELKAHHHSLVDEYTGLRVKLVLRQLDDPMKVRLVRKQIARAMTIINQKQASAQAGAHKTASR